MATRMIDGTSYTIRSSKRGDYVLYQGEKVDPDDLVRLLATSKYSHGKKLYVSQGGLSTAVAASADTHAWLHVYDISIRGWTKAQVWAWCVVAMWNGIRPFPRGFTFDSFQGRTVSNISDGNEHIHCIVGGILPVGHPARYQQLEYDKHGDGLIGSAAYTGPWLSVKDKRWADSPYNPANRVDGAAAFTVKADPSLLGLNISRQPMLSRLNGERINAIAIVKRWGRDNALTSSGNYYALQYLEPIQEN